MLLNINKDKIMKIAECKLKVINFSAPAFDLFIRLWVANVFWKSGLQKLQSWDSTVALFEYEYQVPILSPGIAAFLGTGIELIFPVLLVLGLAGRASAFVLLIFNIMAVISYPDLNAVGLKDHQYWGLLLMVTLFHGPGKLSIDHIIKRKFCPHAA